MAATSMLPIDGIDVNGTGYGGGLANAGVFVSGSGSISDDPEIANTPTEDGVMQGDIIAKTFNVNWELYGDYTALQTSAPDQDEFTPSIEALTGAAQLGPVLYGSIGAQYDDRTKRTRCTARGKEIITPEALLTAAAVAETTGGALA